MLKRGRAEPGGWHKKRRNALLKQTAHGRKTNAVRRLLGAQIRKAQAVIDGHGIGRGVYSKLFLPVFPGEIRRRLNQRAGDPLPMKTGIHEQKADMAAIPHGKHAN